MKQGLALVVVVGWLAGGGVASAGGVAERCVSEQLTVEVAPVTSRATAQGIRMQAQCEGASVLVQRVDGTLRQRVNLSHLVDHPDRWGSWGWLSAPVANGVGTWQITHVQDPSGSYQMSRPISFVVPRASIIPLRAIAWSSTGRTHTVKSRVLKYTSTGALVPMAGLTVHVSGSRYLDATDYPLATLRTDANGWFTYSRKLTQEFKFQFATPRVSLLVASAKGWQAVLFRPGVVLTSYHGKVAVGVPTTVKGYAGPGVRVVGLSAYDDTVNWYVDTGARATTGTGGNFVLRYTPWREADALALVTPPGGEIMGVGPTPGFFVDVVDPTVRLTGKATAKDVLVVRAGSVMSTYGHLDLVDPNGATTPYQQRRVLVQIRPRSTPTAPYRTVAGATTTSTGYYYTNWTATVDADVRVVHLSDNANLRSVFTYLRFLDVR